METIRGFSEKNRYYFDTNVCSSKKGWAQVDTEQDAWYYGHWINPTILQIFSYVEGDTILQKCESVKEFVNEIYNMKKWHEEYEWRFYGIDPMGNEETEQKLVKMGLRNLIH